MYFDNFTVGQRFKTEPYLVTKEDIFVFAAKYDPLSIHLYDEFADASVYGGIIAPGLYTLCVVWGQWGRLQVVDKEVIGGLCMDNVNWSLPVRPGDTLTADMEVAELIPSTKGGRGILVIKTTAFNQNNEVVMTAQVKGLIMNRPL